MNNAANVIGKSKLGSNSLRMTMKDNLLEKYNNFDGYRVAIWVYALDSIGCYLLPPDYDGSTIAPKLLEIRYYYTGKGLMNRSFLTLIQSISSKCVRNETKMLRNCDNGPYNTRYTDGGEFCFNIMRVSDCIDIINNSQFRDNHIIALIAGDNDRDDNQYGYTYNDPVADLRHYFRVHYNDMSDLGHGRQLQEKLEPKVRSRIQDSSCDHGLARSCPDFQDREEITSQSPR